MKLFPVKLEKYESEPSEREVEEKQSLKASKIISKILRISKQISKIFKKKS